MSVLIFRFCFCDEPFGGIKKRLKGMSSKERRLKTTMMMARNLFIVTSNSTPFANHRCASRTCIDYMYILGQCAAKLGAGAPRQEDITFNYLFFRINSCDFGGAGAWCMPSHGVLYRNSLPEPERGAFLWYHFGVPHRSEVPHFFSKSQTRKAPYRQLPV